jgi:erythromycin esterase
LVSLTPADTAFDDLQPLAEAVGNARIVMLGEASHGDGGTFLGKTRLIQFLHQRLGFDVLVFESGLYECWRAWQAIRSGAPPMEALRMGVFGVWSQSEELRPLARYLAATAQSQYPLEVAGVDIQRSGTVTPEFAGDLAEVLRRVAPETLDTSAWTTFLSIQGHLADRSYVAGDAPLPSAEEQEAFAGYLSWLRRRLATVTADVGSLDIPFWDQLLRNLDTYARMVWLVDPANLSETPADGRIRERGLADNLLWMARTRYPDRKLIVWGATRHTARHLAEVEVPRTDIQLLYDSIPTVGQLVWEALGDSVYSLGFTAYEGATATVFGHGGPVPTPREGSLEDLLAGTGRDHAFLDLRVIEPGGAWLLDTLVARPLGYLEMRAQWPRVLDGIVFMKTMTPAHRAAGSGR